MTLNGKNAVVTGAGAGIGRAVAERLATDGARVVVSDVDPDSGTATVLNIRAQGGTAVFVPCDVADRAQVEEGFRVALAELGSIDVLVNNAGGAVVAGEKLPLYETGVESIERMLDVNLMGTIWWTHATVAHMKERGSGRILNMSSVSGMQGGTPAIYATAKGAIIAFTKSIAAEMAQFGVTVNCVSPWAIATREGPANLPTRVGRKGTAEDVANLVAFLASHEADFITGSNYVIDGGYTSGK